MLEYIEQSQGDQLGDYCGNLEEMIAAWTKVGNSRGGERSGHILGGLVFFFKSETMRFTDRLDDWERGVKDDSDFLTKAVGGWSCCQLR